jgi:predicted PolB exonuclease-like 3'-5' exonuclease
VPFTVFDIETRIDKALLNAALYRHESLSDEDAYARAREEMAARGTDFFPLAFHVPIAIVLGSVDDAHVLTDVESLGTRDPGEAALVRAFWDRLEQRQDTLVSFNGRSFDLPVLELAAFRHGLAIPTYFRAGYRDRDSDATHYDVYDVLTNHGTYGVRGGFHLLSRLIGLPGKGQIDGADVQTLWESGRLAEIAAYCRRDVIQTYFLFLRLELLRGRITKADYTRAEAATLNYRTELD